MKTTVLLILSFLITFSLCAQQKRVKKRLSVITTYYDKGNGKIRSYKRNDKYEVYDKQGREIEWATYGEVTESRSTSDDGNTVIKDDWNNSNIFMSHFTTYDSNGRQVREETWHYHDNEKYELWDYSIFKYNDLGLLVKELTFSGKDTLKEAVTYIYDRNDNNIDLIDSSFNRYPGVKLTISDTQNQFDTVKRLVSSTEFLDGKFLLRKKYLYDGVNTIELRYDDRPNKLWAETQTTYSILSQQPSSARILEGCWQAADPNDPTETDEIYIRNRDGLLEQIKTYYKGTLQSITRFSYTYY